MEELLEAIEAGLIKQKISASAASERAVGNTSFIKNLQNRRSDKGRPHFYESLKSLTDVLGLELYVGPPRDTRPPSGFSETSDGIGTPDQVFRPVPHHRLDPAVTGTSVLAVRRDWVDQNGLVLDTLLAFVAPADDMTPAIAQGDLLLIDTAGRPTEVPDLYVFRAGHRDLRLGWLLTPGPDQLVAFFDRPYTPPLCRSGDKGTHIAPLGRIAACFGSAPAAALSTEMRQRMLAAAKGLIGT